ncbi:hypothetical protein COLO4_36495 [Corchorus olitorius]|uniref:BURP domain-containing protein n=1 Tax=Corchorus olitorius TaxID=93759 RepID=A0A1R3G8S7_9ROSI|nr:hypothetical protein COLO4_36495 [Corchorus olitorius]
MAMASHFLLTFALLNLLFAGNHGALYDEEGYWNSVFPNTPMPKALKDLLSPADSEEVPFTKWVDEADPNGGNKLNYLYVGDSSFPKYPLVDPFEKDNGIPYETPDKFSMQKDNGRINSSYFLQKDLRVGTKANLSFFVKPTMGTKKFLPYTVAESMPFSSDKLPEILKHYSIEAGSMEAKAMNVTIRNCARASSYSIGEDKYCATSLKSFIDLSVSKLGKNIKLLAREIEDGTDSPFFTIGKGVRIMGKKEIVCHSMSYPYVVFACHSIENTVVYRVPLLGINGGRKALALAVCHLDTSGWDPNHPSFKILKIKPGTLPVCHFLNPDTLVWVSK